jgi:hypothetical protein
MTRSRSNFRIGCLRGFCVLHLESHRFTGPSRPSMEYQVQGDAGRALCKLSPRLKEPLLQLTVHRISVPALPYMGLSSCY